MEQKRKLNIVFHKVIAKGEAPSSLYDLDIEFIRLLIKKVGLLLQRTPDTQLQVFFDDGYENHFEVSQQLRNNYELNVTVGVVTDNVGKPGYMTDTQINSLLRDGIVIASHGVSHTALGEYYHNVVRKSPAGGKYRNAPRGRETLLHENEIKYQAIESLRWFREHGINISDFIYPYGIYNQQIQGILVQSGYSRVYACDPRTETAQDNSLALPRVVIDNSLSVDSWVDMLGELV
jgi:hypothetical protein